MRQKLSTALELAGGTGVAVGAFTVNVTVGLVVTGALLVTAGWLLER